MWRSALHSLTEDTFSSPRVVTWVVSTTTFISAGTHVFHVDSNVTERLQEGAERWFDALSGRSTDPVHP